MKNILVTGCNGQLGSELRELTQQDNGGMTFFFTDIEQLDITDEEAVNRYVNEHEIDCIVNCAAFTAVDLAESKADFCRILNEEAPAILARAVAGRGGSMIQISTDYVFDGTAHIPYREEDAVCPVSVYGKTKLGGERAVAEACPESVIIRTAWLYSSYGKNFVKTMLRLGQEKPELGVVADQVGTPTYARDLARTILVILSKGLVPGVYHYSNEGVASWYDFTKAIHRLGGVTGCRVKPLHTEEYPTPAERPHYSILDKTKIKETYGVEIPYWEDALAECIQILDK